ncbi:zinc knuckle CX2CX4HX4C containing protein [Tanacetum coccineum]
MKWSPYSNLTKEDLTKVHVWVKLHNVPMVAFTSDGLRMIATKIGNPIMLDSYTSSMCMESWGHGSFARALIELDAICGLKDRLVVIPKLEGSGYTMETIRVEYEWKPPRCDECKIFGHSCDNCPKKPSTSHTQSNAGKQKDVQEEDGFHSMKLITGKCGNWESQGKRQASGFNKTTNGSYRPVVKPKSSTPVSNPFSALEEDNGNYMDDLIDVIRKKVEDLPRKIGICSGRKADYPKRNVVFSPEMKVHDFKFINP